MALFQTYYGLQALSGKDLGDRFSQSRGQGILQTAVRPVPSSEVTNFVPWRNLQEAQARWPTLTAAQQTAWNDFAFVTQFYDIQGVNNFTNGEKYFVAWNTNNRTFNGVFVWFDAPPPPPSWI